MFGTDQQVLQAVADSLHLAGGPSALPPFWANIVTPEHSGAFNEIRSFLLNRRYTQAQIDLWDDGWPAERNLSLFRLFSSPQGNGFHSPETVKQWDIRPSLTKLILTINGVACIPGGDTAPVQDSQGEIGVGRIKSSSNNCVPGFGRRGDFCNWGD